MQNRGRHDRGGAWRWSAMTELLRVLVGAVVALLLAAPTLVVAQAQPAAGAVIVGRVTSETGAPIGGAAVSLVSGADGRVLRTALSDASGTYRMAAVPAGPYRLRASFLGYEPAERVLVAAAGEQHRADLELRIAALAVEGVEVRARRDIERERARFESEAGVTARVIGGDELKIVPGLAEADVMRAVELLPGVVSTSDFSSAFNVRGGSADQNLILLDGFPIFNPFHLGGLFSVFNPDMVARAELLAGGFGAEYGGRVSSVLNVESHVDPERPGVTGEAGVSLLAARLALRSALPTAVPGALGGEGGAWAVSVRRSYFDQLLRPVLDFPYHLTDLQAHGWVGLPRGGRLRLTLYTGEDVLDLTDFNPPGDDITSVLRLAWRWGNDVAGVHWQQPIRGEWLADLRFGFSRYRDGLRLADFDDTRFSSRISQLGVRGDLRRDFAQVGLRTGVEAARLRYGNHAEAGGAVFADDADHGVVGGAYATVRWRPDDVWLVEGGARLDSWAGRDTTLIEASPRLAVKRFLGADRDAAVKLSVGRYVQFLQSLRNEEFPLSNDLWYAADRNTPAVVSDQVQAGLERFWGDAWYASAEAYLREFRGVAELNPASDPNRPEEDLLTGRGRSRGLDLLVRRTAGSPTGWITLSLLQAERTLPDPLAEARGEPARAVTFPPFWDRRVNLNVVLQHELPGGWHTGLRWNLGTGLPYTRPVAQHTAWEYRVDRHGFRLPPTLDGSERGDRLPLYVVLGDRNQHRYPAYQRVDVTVRRSFTRRWGEITPYLQVLNLTNRRNVLFYFYNFDRSPPTRSGVSMFPLLPTLGFEASF